MHVRRKHVIKKLMSDGFPCYNSTRSQVIITKYFHMALLPPPANKAPGPGCVGQFLFTMSKCLSMSRTGHHSSCCFPHSSFKKTLVFHLFPNAIKELISSWVLWSFMKYTQATFIEIVHCVCMN